MRNYGDAHETRLVLNNMLSGLTIHFVNYDRVGESFNWPHNAAYGVLRLHNSGVSWRTIETAKGIYDFNLLDRIVAGARRWWRKKDLIFTLHNIPQWAASNNDDDGYGPGSGSEPKDMQDWQDFIAMMVCRYRGKIKYWEGINEWGHNSMTASVATELQRILWHTVKAIDPDAVVLSPSSPHWTRLEEIMERIRPYCDVVSHHFYDGMDGYQTLETPLKEVLRLANGKPVWDTEFGWQKALGHGADFSDMPPEEQASRYHEHVALTSGYGVQASILHSWNGVMGFEKSTEMISAWKREWKT
jgi:hypothetical protein